MDSETSFRVILFEFEKPHCRKTSGRWRRGREKVRPFEVESAAEACEQLCGQEKRVFSEKKRDRRVSGQARLGFAKKRQNVGKKKRF